MDTREGIAVALVVPDGRIEDWDDPAHARYGTLQDRYMDTVDLVVLPEGYLYEDDDGPVATVTSWAEDLEKPVLAGLETKRGFQVGVYVNPEPRSGETRSHVYVKHSTAARLAFEWPGYRDVREQMFKPICLGGERLGVLICHDMFFGLIPARLARAGATCLINLTGSDVVRRKWTNVLQARSIEHGLPFLCTMTKYRDSGAAEALAFDGRDVLLPHVSETEPSGHGGFVIVETRGAKRRKADLSQACSTNRYEDLRVAVRHGASGDVAIASEGERLLVDGRSVPDARWTTSSNARLLALPLHRLPDPAALYRIDWPRSKGEHIVIYYAKESPRDLDATIALMRMRAIEHRVGILLVAGDERAALKTNNYKNIQRIQEIEGRFGFNRSCLAGTNSVSTTTKGNQGIPRRWLNAYLELM